MATETFWIGNTSRFAYKRGTLEVPAHTLKRVVALEMTTDPGTWVTASVSAGLFTKIKDVSGVPCNSSNVPIDQTAYLTVEQALEDEVGLLTKYQALLKEYDALYAAADAADVVLTTFSAPSAYNLPYWPVVAVV